MPQLSGCNLKQTKEDEKTKVVFTTGFGRNEVFRIEDKSCSLKELKVFLLNTQNSYQQLLGSDIWNAKQNGESLEEKICSSSLERIAQIKTMRLLAEKYKITLTKDEEKRVLEAAKEYYESLSDADISQMDDITQEDIQHLYEDIAFSKKLYKYMIRDINPEVSDDEARTLTVEQIYKKTYVKDVDGNKKEMSKQQKAAVYKKMEEVKKKIADGAEFEALISTYNEAAEDTISFGKGDKEEAIENAAFNLSTGQISNIVETSDGYIILKCVTTFNKEETKANKEKIVEQRKSEAFSKEYDSFATSLSKEVNKKLWKKVTLCTDKKATTHTFFDVFEKYFGEK